MQVGTTVFLVLSIVIALISFALAQWLSSWVKGRPASSERIEHIGALIRSGANTFLRQEYNILAKFAGIVAILILLFLPHPIWQGGGAANLIMAICYLCGTLFSAIAGVLGIRISTIANVKTAEAARKGIKPSFMAGFRGGAVMGMAVVGGTLLGAALVILITRDTNALLGFSFGASSLALFAKAGGGIFTKTADISADLVGKVELGIPEDDPRNPAVIADNVGDNVGDVAGMGADLFDSNVASLAAALVLATALDKGAEGKFTSMVFCYAAAGLLASIIGVATARMGKNGNPTRALNSSTYVTTTAFVVLTALANVAFGFEWRVWGASVVGLLVGVVIGFASDYFTDDTKKPVHNVAKASETGPAFTILSGVSYGFISALPSMVGIAVSALAAYKFCYPLGGLDYAMYGIAMSAVGMLSIVGMIVSNDAYGPIVDNARGLAEMGDLGDKVLDITDSLDSAGNTVKAITKGFAIGSAGLTVISLLGAFISQVNSSAAALGISEKLTGFDVMNPIVFFGLLIGAAIPAIFSAMLMLGVGRNAERMVSEIHRQFQQIAGLKEGKEGVSPEYDKCIAIATTGSLKELIPAGLVTILVTIAVGFIGGVQAIGGYLCGNIVTGLFLALFMSNSGGLWDNSKKYVESGHNGGKGSDAHKAAVIGDTVGDPFKDTAGPSINTQITVVSLIASLMATIFLTSSLIR
ncbi:MAG TPA: sodium-translocating pyrophosphatase [Ruminococcaceae bacterium]|jgi:K(+)-stimulated pyrophosphate-energized sodium pump|nr:sodium-translocating pyrophosphatase [Oscillospiraceae bacterium]HBG55806.1 sodium-translocating pyrophosphatase [Oscillospiraceae bacterium]HBQ45618.1 sodium-translocating pyrophosphatase [Oscillospiraceae bacterium]HBT90550.1 sodium-translocating pyrophosphatase [Oscillospiraceae bacterium]HCB91662.1 sodium-translocating pyrophosphatase [Oscillospiraceae bacterium]